MHMFHHNALLTIYWLFSKKKKVKIERFSKNHPAKLMCSAVHQSLYIFGCEECALSKTQEHTKISRQQLWSHVSIPKTTIE